MTIRHLRIFLEVTRCKSMSQAAANLHFSQSTISQTIKELEKYYNTTLFERLSKRLYITESGKTLQEFTKKVISSFDDLEDVMLEQSASMHVFLGATITCGCCVLPSFLKNFQKKYPDVQITSSIHNTHLIEEKMLNGEIDIAIVEGKMVSKDIVTIPVIDDFLVLAFAANHEFASKKSFTPKELRNREFVVREEGSGTRKIFDDYLAKHNINIVPKIEAPFPEAMRHSIINNNCLAVMSQRLLEDQIITGEIKVLRLNTNEWDRHFSVVYHKDKRQTYPIRAVIGSLIDFSEYDEHVPFH